MRICLDCLMQILPGLFAAGFAWIARCRFCLDCSPQARFLDADSCTKVARIACHRCCRCRFCLGCLPQMLPGALAADDAWSACRKCCLDCWQTALPGLIDAGFAWAACRRLPSWRRPTFRVSQTPATNPGKTCIKQSRQHRLQAIQAASAARNPSNICGKQSMHARPAAASKRGKICNQTGERSKVGGRPGAGVKFLRPVHPQTPSRTRRTFGQPFVAPALSVRGSEYSSTISENWQYKFSIAKN